ncbi:hypothetical protein FOA43_002379 [Brettanomyces nanus]|uniref:Uncharacterized protein n=1 Tax=Eeniella nana TaxID=13502 RepID=A0A875S5K5_EENNA|nr:uncharacterized protein FOA43_002379 [Brettanomyces nanus]QPG75039.1 hypothetical protein FOA43_002379 [Brettanomyces nanus]
MPELKFNASRFNIEANQSNRPNRPNQANRANQADENEPSSYETTSKGLMNTQFYHVYQRANRYPPLDTHSGEKILFCDSYPLINASILISNRHIYVYSANNDDFSSYTLKFEYTKNEFGILPQVQLITNLATPSQPDLIIVDCITGIVRYIEALKLIPSLSILQNEHTLQLKLSRGELFTLTEYNEDVGLVLATNYRKVICVSLKDQFGRIQLSQDEIIPSQVSFKFLRMLSYNIETYDDSNKIMALRFEHKSSLLTRLFVLEEQGTVHLVDFVKGTGHHISAKTNLTELMLPQVSDPKALLSLKLKDVGSLGNDKFLVLISQNDGSMSLVVVKFDSDLIVESQYHLKSVQSTDVYPRLYILFDSKVSFILVDHRLIFSDTADLSDTSTWEDFVSLNPEVEIYGASSLPEGGENRSMCIMTSDGVIHIDVLAPGERKTAQQFLKNRIEEYLQFESAELSVNFDMAQSSYDIRQNEIEGAILDISDEILTNKSSLLQSYLVISDNLKRRFELMKKLAQYISENFIVADSYKMVVVNNTERLGLASYFYDFLAENDDLTTSVDSLLQSDKYRSSMNLFFSQDASRIVDLLQDFISTTFLEQIGNEASLSKLATVLNELLNAAYIAPERDVKGELLNIQYDINVKAKPIFFDHIRFLKDINGMIRKLALSYASQLDNDIDTEIKTAVSKAILGLSPFLYYSCNDLLQYAECQGDDQTTAKHNLEEFYNANRKHWIDIFILLRKQNEIIKFVEGFDDLQSLSELLESEREAVETISSQNALDPIEIENMSAAVEHKFDVCFQKYQYSFAEKLFALYVHSNKVDLLLTRFFKYSDYLSQFLNGDLSHYKFSWILSIQNDNFDEASSKLLKYTDNSDQENIENKKLQLNIAKLSLIAENQVNPDQLCDIESQLDVLSLQEKYEDVLLSRFHSLDQDSATTLLKESRYLSSNLSLLTRKVFHLIVDKLGHKIQLSLSELTDFLTLEDFSVVNCDPFDDIFKLLSNILHVTKSHSTVLIGKTFSERQIQILLALAFKRLILTDDWTALKQGKDLEQSKFLKVLANLSSYNIGLPKSIDQLYISKDDLKCLGLDRTLFSDYFKENDLLEHLDEQVNLMKWLSLH